MQRLLWTVWFPWNEDKVHTHRMQHYLLASCSVHYTFLLCFRQIYEWVCIMYCVIKCHTSFRNSIVCPFLWGPDEVVFWANDDTQTQVNRAVALNWTICINPLNAELNPICYLLVLLAHHFLHVSRIRVKSLTLRLLMSYIYGAPILDVSRSHTTTQHSR